MSVGQGHHQLLFVDRLGGQVALGDGRAHERDVELVGSDRSDHSDQDFARLLLHDQAHVRGLVMKSPEQFWQQLGAPGVDVANSEPAHLATGHTATRAAASA